MVILYFQIIVHVRSITICTNIEYFENSKLVWSTFIETTLFLVSSIKPVLTYNFEASCIYLASSSTFVKAIRTCRLILDNVLSFFSSSKCIGQKECPRWFDRHARQLDHLKLRNRVALVHLAKEGQRNEEDREV